MRRFAALVSIVLAAWGVLPLIAQDATPAPRFISDDAVNAVAARMYCPVCEFVPLDTCGEAACMVWKEEIREQLAAGRTADQIISGFVERYGDRVVGVPQDPGLRLLSIIGPVIVAIAALFTGFATFLRWQRRQVTRQAALTAEDASSVSPGATDYRARVERDLLAE